MCLCFGAGAISRSACSYPPVGNTLQQWDAAPDSQEKVFLIAVREASGFMLDGARIVAITYA